MPREAFQLRIDQWAEIHSLPDSWPTAALRDVLRLADFDDAVADDDVAEMAVMALQDLPPREASELVLEVLFGDAMSAGVRQNLSDDLGDDRPWEHYAGVSRQAGIFEAVVLLQRAFPRSFGVPDALRLRVEVQAKGEDGCAWLRSGPRPALLLRLFASGMEGGAILRRLYESELAGDRFPDANGILWRIDEVERSEVLQPTTCVYDVYSSCQWLAPLEGHEPWQAAGWPDGET